MGTILICFYWYPCYLSNMYLGIFCVCKKTKQNKSIVSFILKEENCPFLLCFFLLTMGAIWVAEHEHHTQSGLEQEDVCEANLPLIPASLALVHSMEWSIRHELDSL